MVLEEVEATQQNLDAPEEAETATRHRHKSVVINWLLSYAVEAIANNELITGLCCVVLCVLARLAKMSQRQMSWWQVLTLCECQRFSIHVNG